MLRYLIAFFFLFGLFLSCGEVSLYQTIPYAPVNFTVNPNGADHDLKNPLAYRLFFEADRRLPDDRMGYAGLLVVTGLDGTLFAFDCCCPYEDNRTVRVVPDQNGKAKCPGCGSTFLTIYGLGTREAGPANESLQIYRVVSRQDGSFQILN